MDKPIRDLLAKDLTRSRAISVKVGGDIMNRLSVSHAVDGLKPNLLGTLEEFELELLFAPLFTPSQKDRYRYEGLLPREGIPLQTVMGSVALLHNEGLHCPLSEGNKVGQLEVPQVVAERYARLLQLHQKVDERVSAVCARIEDEAMRNLAMSLARQPVWKRREALLAEILDCLIKTSTLTIEKFEFLTKYISFNRPRGMGELKESLQSLVDAYRQEESHPVFNTQLADKQQNAIRSKYCGEAVKKHRIAMAEALLSDLGEC